MANQRNGTIYIGVTSNLPARVRQHKDGQADGFTKQYNVKTLVYYAVHEAAEAAIRREEKMKEWQRAWKPNLIEKDNPQWKDLFETISG